MSNSFSHPEQPTLLRPWCSLRLDWPYKIVSVVAQVTLNPQQHPFEWAIVRILESWTGELPTLERAADELGFKDPVFLVEALERLIESGVVEHVDPAADLDLPNCRLTHLAQVQRIPAAEAPERHGMTLCFDVLTGDHVTPMPASMNHEAQ